MLEGDMREQRLPLKILQAWSASKLSSSLQLYLSFYHHTGFHTEISTWYLKRVTTQDKYKTGVA